MKADNSIKIYNKLGVTVDNINKVVKAVILNFNDGRGDIIVHNDNYNTRRKYPDFTKGKATANLHPLQIVFVSIADSKISHQRYIDKNDNVCYF